MFQKFLQSLKRIKKNKGFTLAEFFIAITIFSFISLALFYSLNTALKVYKQESNFDNAYSGIQLISTVMERELQNAIYLNDIRLIGTASTIYFHSPSVFSDIDYPVNKVVYSVITNENESIYIQRTSENPFSGELEEEETSSFSYQYNPENFVTNIQFEYLSFVVEEGEGEEESESQILWKENWEEEYLPDAVKIKYSLSGVQGASSYESIIVLPGAWNNVPKEEE